MVATKVAESHYVPKLDIVLGFNAPKGFTSWMTELSNTLKFDLMIWLEIPLKQKVSPLRIDLFNLQRKWILITRCNI